MYENKVAKGGTFILHSCSSVGKKKDAPQNIAARPKFFNF